LPTAGDPMNLIDIKRAKRSIQSVTDNTQDALLGVLVAACSDAVAKYCRRDFSLRGYDELYNGGGDRRLLLRQYPVQAVQSVRYRQVTVLKISNNAPSQNQQARVQVTSTGLILTRTASGVTTNDSGVTWANNGTLNAVAAAVNALGNGWSAQIVGDPGAPGPGDYGLWPSADLYIPPSFGDGTISQGSLGARNQFAELKMHTYELQGWQFDPRGWLLRAIPYTDPELLHPEDLIWPVGVNNFRIQYTAGHATIPESVQEACAEWVAILYYNTQRDPSLASQSIAGSVSQSWGSIQGGGMTPPAGIAKLLAPYRRFAVGTNQS
jgi:hypothetical protein